MADSRDNRDSNNLTEDYPEKYLSYDFGHDRMQKVSEKVSEREKESTERWRSFMRQGVDQHLDDLHKQRWADIAADIRERLHNAPNKKAKARVEKEMNAHDNNRDHPETSRKELLAEIDTREPPPPSL